MKFLGDASSLLLAVALALMVWLAATQAAEPLLERQIEGPDGRGLPVELVGVPPGMATYGLTSATARVTIRGISEDLDALSSGGVLVKAVIASERTDGPVTATLHAECVECARRAVRIMSVAPRHVTVFVEPVDRSQVAVEAAADAPGVQTCRGVEATFSPTNVTVSGARSRVALVRRVLAQVRDENGASDDVAAGAVPVLPVAADGSPVADVTVVPEAVSAAITFVQLDTCADVAVLPVYSEPPSGYYVAGIDVSPDHIQLRGEPDRLAAFRLDAVVSTQLIDLSESHESVVRLTALDVPADLETVGVARGVTVTIRVSPVPGTRSIEVPLEARDVPTGLVVGGLSPSRIAVLLSGPLPVLDGLDDSSLVGFVSTGGLGIGTHRLTPRLELPPGIRIRSISPSEVEVRLGQDGGNGG